jgi:hypothetical protein
MSTPHPKAARERWQGPRSVALTNGKTEARPAPRRSASAEATALRRGFIDEAAGFEPPPAFTAGGDPPATRPCAHAEAAALRWLEQNPDGSD